MIIPVDENISLEFLEKEQAPALLNLVNGNRTYLREWLPWVDNMNTVENFEQYIMETKKRAADKTDFGFAIIIDRNIAGRIGMHKINRQNKIGEIGYWLADGLQGRGIITRCCTAMINFGFNELGLNRIEIKCAVGNDKSKAIPEKLGFTFEGVLRKAEWLNGEFVDLNLFSLLKAEWQKNRN